MNILSIPRSVLLQEGETDNCDSALRQSAHSFDSRDFASLITKATTMTYNNV